MKSSLFALSACALALLTAPAGAAGGEPAVLGLGGNHLLTLRGAHAAARVDMLEGRLAELLRPGLKASDITLEKRGGDFVVNIDGKLFVTLAKTDAKACGTPLADYAAQIHQHLLNTLPQLAPLR